MKEQQNIEWKESWRDEYLKWICAFANTDGGSLFIGPNDKGVTIGLDNAEALLEVIPSKIKSHLGIIASVMIEEEDEKSRLKIDVHPYSNPISYKGKYYIRSGSTTHELNSAELSTFILRKSGKSWDEDFEDDFNEENIDRAWVLDLIQDGLDNGRLPDTDGLSTLEVLEKLRVVRDKKFRKAAVVLFGRDPNNYIPKCQVMIGRFGVDNEDLKFHEVVEGNLVYLLKEVLNQLNQKFLIRPIEFEGIMRKEKEEYPMAALREMLLNALVHRTYGHAAIQIRVFDDRLSIWNEGRLPTGLTIESLKEDHSSISPNPFIADVCFKAGYIDTWGRGTLKIFKACNEAGLPEPRILEKDGGIEVTLYKYDISEKLRRKLQLASDKMTTDLDKNMAIFVNEYGDFIDYLSVQASIPSEKLRTKFGETAEDFRRNFGDKKALLLFLIGLKPKITAKEASIKIQVSDRTIETYLAQLKDQNTIRRIGPDKGGLWSIILNDNK